MFKTEKKELEWGYSQPTFHNFGICKTSENDVSSGSSWWMIVSYGSNWLPLSIVGIPRLEHLGDDWVLVRPSWFLAVANKYSCQFRWRPETKMSNPIDMVTLW